ncbi:hypothetical protein [Hydrogenophilus thermoluteolus]|uniref:hypothetical protein n=1 Tax=Hydrogenophilus thermoluteolus TaxID=297 RepID=UPI003F6691AE
MSAKASNGWRQEIEPEPGSAHKAFDHFVATSPRSDEAVLRKVAGILTAYLGHWIDAAVIFAVVIVSAVLGALQEGRPSGRSRR